MNVHNTSIHVVIGKYTVRHICHVFDLTESVQCDLAVDAFVAFRCAVLMPGRLDETRGNGIDCDAGASTLARNKNYYKPQKCGLFYVKFYLFLCCTELYFIFICDIMRYETQL